MYKNFKNKLQSIIVGTSNLRSIGAFDGKHAHAIKYCAMHAKKVISESKSTCK